jgi:hypothetical protein
VAGENGQAGPPVMVSFGPADDDVIPLSVASRMLTLLCEREEVLFPVLLAEAMTGTRLAKTRHRTQPGDRQPAELAGG